MFFILFLMKKNLLSDQKNFSSSDQKNFSSFDQKNFFSKQKKMFSDKNKKSYFWTKNSIYRRNHTIEPHYKKIEMEENIFFLSQTPIYLQSHH